MRVTAWNSGGSTYGIRIGFPNRAQFFDPSWTEIEVELGGHFHTFPLTPGFWNHCPEVLTEGHTAHPRLAACP